MNTTLLPALTETMLLEPAAAKSFQKNGHVLLKNIVPASEMAPYRDAINNAAYKYNTEKRAMADRDTYGKAFLQIMNLWEQDEAVRRFTLARRFAKLAADLLGVANVRLYHDQALYKESGGGHTPWHQDQYYWPLSTANTVTMWMPLIDIDEDMGMLTFASGSHRDGFVENVAISDESDSVLQKYIAQKGFAIDRPKTMQAGDATFHYGWTLHSAPPNQSAQTREVMTIIYFADGATVNTPQNSHQEADRQRWLLGTAPGHLAASPLNPLLL